MEDIRATDRPRSWRRNDVSLANSRFAPAPCGALCPSAVRSTCAAAGLRRRPLPSRRHQRGNRGTAGRGDCVSGRLPHEFFHWGGHLTPHEGPPPRVQRPAFCREWSKSRAAPERPHPQNTGFDVSNMLPMIGLKGRNATLSAFVVSVVDGLRQSRLLV